ncbi:MAG: hypothetical protein AAB449_00315 [Patescibacteria group bacterium]
MSTIEQQVMASVGVIYALRQLFSRTALKLYVCAMSLYGMAQLVWVERVFTNLEHTGLVGLARFIFSAVFNTELAVQLILAVFVVALFSLALDFFRSSAPMRAIA